MTTIDKLQKDLYQAYDDIAYYKRRIERLNTQLQQKENIIKEVREKIKEDNLYLEEAKKMYIEDTDDEMLKIHALQLIINDLSHIDSYLKILDKENKDV